MRRKPLFTGILLLLLLVVVGFLFWSLNPLGPSAEAYAALQSDTVVNVESHSNWIVFIPIKQQTETAFIFYPGGRVDYRSYAPMLREIAMQGYQVFMVRMPLNLAVFTPGRAGEVMRDNPSTLHWVVGGHSLGGAMAANYAYQNPGRVAGLVLWAAYPAGNNNLQGQNLPVLSISASDDGLADPEKIEASRALLPPSTRWVIIQGGNHAQFGSYGPQGGDFSAKISPLAQQNLLVESTVRFMQDVSALALGQ